MNIRELLFGNPTYNRIKESKRIYQIEEFDGKFWLTYNGALICPTDMFIAEPKKKQGKTYHGLFIELKKEDTKIYKKDGTLVANEHIREQYDTMQQLRQAGYYADFACGRNAAKSLIDWYLA